MEYYRRVFFQIWYMAWFGFMVFHATFHQQYFSYIADRFSFMW